MPDANLNVIVLAAGRGTRMKSATPKVLHEVAGLPLLGHVLAAAQALDPDRVILVVRHQRERVSEVARALLPGIVIAEQGDVPGTGAAAEAGLSAVDPDFIGDVLIVSGDVPLLDAQTLSRFVEVHRDAQSAATIMTARLDDPTGYGRVLRDGRDGVRAIVEERDASPEERAMREVNAGSYVFRVNDLRRSLEQIGTDNAQREKYVTDAVAALKLLGESVAAFEVADARMVAGVNDRVQLAAIGREVNRRIIERWQRDGVTVQDPGSTWIDASVELGQDVTILPGSILRGTTVVQDEAVIGPFTTLVDCEVGFGATVLRSHGVSARIGENANVGPFSYMRPGTVLGDEGKIGTFVETKNVVIGRGTKLPHLSYAGDAEIGEGGNIGAGTIFANYDGVNKHRTTVGDQVRTGAHNVFVAPVAIGDGVYTGAGTIVRKDIPAGALGITKAPQVVVDDWVLEHRAGTAAADAAEAARRDDDER